MSNNIVNTMPGEDPTKVVQDVQCQHCRMLKQMHPVMIIPNVERAHYARNASEVIPSEEGFALIAATGDLRASFGIYFMCTEFKG